MNAAVMRSRREAESAREQARAAARLKTQQTERVDELRQKQVILLAACCSLSVPLATCLLLLLLLAID